MEPHTELNKKSARLPQVTESVVLEDLANADIQDVCHLIRTNLILFKEAGSVIASSLRRLDRFEDVYFAKGNCFIVAKDRLTSDDHNCIGGAGVGPLHGLAPSEGVGELRDIVVDPAYRGRGIGSRLLKRCIEEAKRLGYTRLYLEATPQMVHAQKLFVRHGFRPVTDQSAVAVKTDDVPSYYILETL